MLKVEQFFVIIVETIAMIGSLIKGEHFKNCKYFEIISDIINII